MTIKTSNIVISGEGPFEIIAGNANRSYLKMENLGSTTIFLHGTSGTILNTANGYPLLQGDTLEDTFYIGSYWGGALAGSNATLNFIEED